MPDITKGKTFSSGDTVTAADLNNLVDDASINNNAINSDKIASGAVTNAKVSTSAAISFSKLETLATGSVIVGDSGSAKGVALSGDATIDAAGALTIATGAVETAMIADSTGSSDGVTTAKLATGAVSGPKIAMGSDAQGDILIRGSSGYERLAAGTAGQILKTNGNSSNPVWTDPPPSITAAGLSITEYTSSTTWTRPQGVTLIHVIVRGAGGGSISRMAGGNGGSKGDFIDVSGTLGGSNNDEIEITVGAGGSAGYGTPGYVGFYGAGDGGDTTFGVSGSDPFLTGGGGTGAGLIGSTESAGSDGSSSSESGRSIGGSGHDTYGAGAKMGTWEDPGTLNHYITSGIAGGSGYVVVTIIG
tara:strand:+ start:1067 stop:2149 length:1083 start_codon:yes stop_codon:yes gene_type:complete